MWNLVGRPSSGWERRLRGEKESLRCNTRSCTSSHSDTAFKILRYLYSPVLSFPSFANFSDLRKWWYPVRVRALKTFSTTHTFLTTLVFLNKRSVLRTQSHNDLGGISLRMKLNVPWPSRPHHHTQEAPRTTPSHFPSAKHTTVIIVWKNFTNTIKENSIVVAAYVYESPLLLHNVNN